jgi:hypothetical protein
LPAQLAADGTAGAGDQNRLAGDHGLHMRRVDLHRLAAEQVFDVDGAHGVDRHLAAHQVVDAGHGEDVGAGAHSQIGCTLARFRGS